MSQGFNEPQTKSSGSSHHNRAQTQSNFNAFDAFGFDDGSSNKSTKQTSQKSDSSWDNFSFGSNTGKSNSSSNVDFNSFSFPAKNDSPGLKKPQQQNDPFGGFSFGGPQKQDSNSGSKSNSNNSSAFNSTNGGSTNNVQSKPFENVDLLGLDEKPEPKPINMSELNEIKFI
jgi:hypothetical protein